MTSNTNRPAERIRFPAADQSDQPRPQGFIQYCDRPEIIPIEIRDLSESGAGFVMTETPRQNSMVVLTLQHKGKTSRIRAVMMWALPVGNRLWRVGCRFAGQLRPGSIDVATERERQTTSIALQIRRGPDSEGRVMAVVVDHSNGGLCIRSAEAFPPNTELVFEAPDFNPPLRFMARVQWTRKDRGSFRMGCSFSDSCDLDTFRQCLPESACQSAIDGSNSNTRDTSRERPELSSARTEAEPPRNVTDSAVSTGPAP